MNERNKSITDGFGQGALMLKSAAGRKEYRASQKRSFPLILIALVFSFSPACIFGLENNGHKPESVKDGTAGQIETYHAMPGPGKKVPITSGHYLSYGFDKKPKLGTVIMKVAIFTKEGNKDASFEVKADAGMPSMRGAHETGDRSFSLSRKGDYLLPINIVMPGDWEIRVTVMKSGKAVFRGRHNFDI